MAGTDDSMITGMAPWVAHIPTAVAQCMGADRNPVGKLSATQPGQPVSQTCGQLYPPQARAPVDLAPPKTETEAQSKTGPQIIFLCERGSGETSTGKVTE